MGAALTSLPAFLGACTPTESSSANKITSFPCLRCFFCSQTQSNLHTDSHFLQPQPLLLTASLSSQPWPSLCSISCEDAPARLSPERDCPGPRGQSSLSPTPFCPVGAQHCHTLSSKVFLITAYWPHTPLHPEGIPGESLTLSRPSEHT